MRLLNRRKFNGLCVALGAFVASSDASAVEPASGTASSGASRTVKFPTGAVVPALGQGSAGLGQGRHQAAEEEEPFRRSRFRGTQPHTFQGQGPATKPPRPLMAPQLRVIAHHGLAPRGCPGPALGVKCAGRVQPRLNDRHDRLGLVRWTGSYSE